MKAKKVFSLLLLSFFIPVSTLFLPTKIDSQKDATNVKLGKPIFFVVQDITAVEYKYPIRVSLMKPKDNPSDFIFLNFIFSVILWFAFFYFSCFLISRASVKDS